MLVPMATIHIQVHSSIAPSASHVFEWVTLCKNVWFSKSLLAPGLVVHVYNPSDLEAKAGESEVYGHPLLHYDSKANLGCETLPQN